MPIISQIGRKARKVRFLYACIYAALLLGALTMVYPFLVMISGSTKSAVDLKDLDIFPRFLRDDRMLYRKYVEGLFNESSDTMNAVYGTSFRNFEDVEPPENSDREMMAKWQEFLADNPPPAYASGCGFVQARISKTIPLNLRNFKKHLAGKFGKSAGEVNRALGTDFAGWNAFFLIPENFMLRRDMPRTDPFNAELQIFKNSLGPESLYYFSADGFYRTLFLKTQYSGDIAAYNASHGTDYSSYDDIVLSRTLPDGTDAEKADWENFVRHTLNLLWVRVDPLAAELYREFLEAKYGKIIILNRIYESDYASFALIPLVEEPPFEGIVLSDWEAFITGWEDPDTKKFHIIPTELLRVDSLEIRFRDWLAARGENNTGRIIIPQRDLHYAEFLGMKKALAWEFATRNFKTVFEYIVLHGRGVLNTAIYCALAVLCALIVNPLAAYAMSRNRMPASYKILLFLMATMAFPPMVTQIPVFLMLRKMQLLNTFAALVLPGLANGYAIFLLKGFFDSLPRELYECAELDGANEWTMFWHITMSLSRPILSVIALQAFTMAYSNFMFALLICQDEKMWTLMVWLYQLQQRSGQPVIYASLIIAAIPTFIIFAVCQKIIIRGIVVPVEK
ncbi:MAG: carbohydrate ABC transporter permease [Kiritimatiellia bacterium]